MIMNAESKKKPDFSPLLLAVSKRAGKAMNVITAEKASVLRAHF